MSNGVTVRIEPDAVIVSRDDGRTVTVEGEVAQRLRAAADAADPETGSLGYATAASLASLAEAAAAEPVDTGLRPATAAAAGEPRVHLGAVASKPSQGLTRVLERRVSERAFAPLQLPQLAALLTRAARIAMWSEDEHGIPITHRPAPSAGARHPIELEIIALEVVGLEAGAYAFDPLRCALGEPREIPVEAVERVRTQAGVTTGPAAIIFCVAHFERTLARYPAGSTLVWRDCGVLLGLLHLVATDLRLASCIVGSAGILDYSRKPLVADIGALAVGAPIN